MNIKAIKQRLFLLFAAAVVFLFDLSAVRAADGTWANTTSGGLWSDPLNWSGGVAADGSGSTANFGTLNLAANNTVLFDEPHTLTSLIFGDTASTYYNWTLSNNGNSANVLTLDGASSITIARGNVTNNVTIAGTSGLVITNIASASYLVFDAANTFTGDVSVNAGTAGYLYLLANNAGALGGSPSATNSVILAASSSQRSQLFLNVSGAAYPVYNQLVMRPLGSSSSSRAELHAKNGSTTWNGGIILDGASGSSAVLCDIYADSTTGTLTVNGNITLTNNYKGQINLRGGTSTAATGVISGVITIGNVTLGKNDSCTWIINSSGNAWGSLNNQNGFIALGINNALPANAPIAMGGTSAIDLKGFSQLLSANVTGGNGKQITSSLPGAVLTFSNLADVSCAVNITGGISLVKTGEGKLTLTTANTYAGNTVINAGTLALSGSAAMASSPLINLASGARLDVSALTATIALGATQTLTGNGGTLAGNMNLNAGALGLSYTSGTPSLIVTNGTLTFNGNAVTVTVSGGALGAGVYKLIAKQASGAVAGTLPANVTVSGLGATASAALQIINGELYLVVGATSTALAASANPSGFNGSVTFTAVVQTNSVTAGDATGTVSFFINSVAFTTSGLVAGTTDFSLSTLPRGTNFVTAIYSGDLNYLPSTNTLSHVVTNHPPVAGNMAVTRNAGVYALRIPISDLLTNVTDVDGDTMVLVGAGTSTNGVIVTVTDTNYLYYNNANNVNDQFTYTVTDGFGGTNSGVISLMVSNAAVGQVTGQFTSFTGGVANLTFHGIPNYSYITERSTDLADWVAVATNSAAANGEINVSDSFSDLGGVPPPSAYYRLKWQP